MFSDNKLARQKLINKPMRKYTRVVWSLYFGTLVVEIIGAAARAVLFLGIFLLVNTFVDAILSVYRIHNPIYTLTGEGKVEYLVSVAKFVAVISIFPIILSVLTIVPALFGTRILPDVIWPWRIKTEAGKLSDRQEEIIDDIIKTFPEKHQQEIHRRRAKLGKRFEIRMIPNSQEEEITRFGDKIYITTALLESKYLGALLARELSHVLSFDSQVERALARFRLYPTAPVLQGAKAAGPHVTKQFFYASDGGRTQATTALGCLVVLLMILAGGELGVAAFCGKWNNFRREREFDADRLAQACGQGEALTEYVQKYKVYDIATPEFLLAMPYSEHRLERLRLRGQGDGGEDVWPSYQSLIGVILFFVVLAALTLGVLLIIPSTRDQLYTYTPQGQATAQAIRATEAANDADIDAGTAFLVGKWSVVEQPETIMIFLDNGRVGLKSGEGREIYDNFLYYMKKKQFYWPLGSRDSEYTVEVSSDNNTVTLVNKSDPAKRMTLKRL